jgi:hypothetical protein
MVFAFEGLKSWLQAAASLVLLVACVCPKTLMKRLLYAAGGVHPLPGTVAVALLAGPVPPEPDDELEALDEELDPPLDEELDPPLDEELDPPLDDEELDPPLDEELDPPLDEEPDPPPDEELELGPPVLVAPAVVADPPLEEVAPAAPPAPGPSAPPQAESNATTEPPTRSEYLRIVTFLLYPPSRRRGDAFARVVPAA